MSPLTGRSWISLLGVLVGLGAVETSASAQKAELAWYFLNVATVSEPSLFSEGGFTDDSRLRGMLAWSYRDLGLDLAYEQRLSFWQNDPLNSNLIFGGGSGSGDWLGLQGNIATWDHGSWDQRVDRVSLAFPLGRAAEVVMGRQAVSWATTLFLTPADPFAPFDPADPFREYRIGVDAARLRFYPGPFSELDLVVRASNQEAGTTITALARGRRSLAGWDLSGWLGLVHDEPGIAVATSGSVSDWAVRGEASVRRDRYGEDQVLRLSAGVDRLFGMGGRDFYLLAEFQHDGWGASSADSLLSVALSDPFARGEMQVLGMDTGLVQGSFQLHPLFSADALVMVNLRDGSGLLVPGGAWSVASDWSLRGGAYLGWGAASGVLPNPLTSEYGLTPATAYLSITAFF